MKLHREGSIILLGYSVVLLLMAVLVFLVYPNMFLQLLIFVPLVILFGFILWFFRIPNRPLPPDDNVVIAPADGKIVVIEKTSETEFFNDERIQVSIFMSPLNVHQNIYPVSGEVTFTKYHKGKYLVAWHPKSSTENERSTVVVKTQNDVEVLFRQIAGAVARRICTYAKVGDEARKGTEFGFIKFGSRVDIFLPLDAKILCKVGDTATNKITRIAEL
ncbi:MAG TPA: phosphatidylserine decarboxylase family protein [Bacteroidales bacterium]|nr:phosphatidylserine decarboxylase family protein [Bacteroidales bacterium]